MPDSTRKVRVTPEVMDRWWTRDHDGNRLRVTWGEADADGFYEPSITVEYADNLLVAERARIRAAVEGLERNVFHVADAHGGARWELSARVPLAGGEQYVDRAAVLRILNGEQLPGSLPDDPS